MMQIIDGVISPSEPTEDLHRRLHKLEQSNASSKQYTLDLEQKIHMLEEAIDGRNQSHSDLHLESSNKNMEGYTTIPTNKDTFIMMMLSKPCSAPWIFAICVFVCQIALLSLITNDQLTMSRGTTPFDVPYSVNSSVRFGQVLAIVVSLATQDDIITAIKLITTLRTSNYQDWSTSILAREHTGNWIVKMTWYRQIFFPMSLKFMEGMMVLFTSFVIVVQSENLIDLFKDFAGMQIISQIDDVLFRLAEQSLFGTKLKRKAKETRRVVFQSKSRFFPIHSVIIWILCTGMVVGWSWVVAGQISGKFFSLKYPNCPITGNNIRYIGDGRCDGGLFNSISCGFDGNDCLDYNMAYPVCKAARPYEVGNGECDQSLNNEACSFDGGDCCPGHNSTKLGDGICNGQLNTKSCNYDNGDCIQFNLKYPDCTVKDPFRIGDGICDGWLYNQSECGYDEGDCAQCDPLTKPWKIGDGRCHGQYNNEACGYDGSDCLNFNEAFPDCKVKDLWRVGDGICDPRYNVTSCLFDGGDCADCIVDDPSLIGNGKCNPTYNTEECSFDGGDCEKFNTLFSKCRVDDPSKLGDGQCDDIVPYNTKKCGYDGGDCMVITEDDGVFLSPDEEADPDTTPTTDCSIYNRPNECNRQEDCEWSGEDKECQQYDD